MSFNNQFNQGVMIMGGHSGARHSSKRNYVYYPFVQGNKAIDEWTRGELIRKSAWAYDEIGWVGGLVDNSAKMCGKITQKANTYDKEWNLLADAAFERVTSSPESFDLSGKHNWRGLVKTVFSENFKAGDCGVILSKAADGSAKIKFVPGYAIADNPEAADDDEWTDGLWLDEHGKAQRYRVIDGNGGHTDYDRKDFVFFSNRVKPDMHRGLPKTFRMLNKVQDHAEIESFWSGGVKASSQVAMQIVNARSEGGAPTGLGATVMGPKKAGKPREKESVYREDLSSDSKLLEMGDERIELLHDKRPAPDQVAYLDYQKRDCAAGWGLSLEATWNWSKAGGAITRTLLAQVQDFVDDEQGVFICQGGVRIRNWIISSEVKSGRLRKCDDAAWWAHQYMFGARKTADFAKDGRIYLEAVNRGELSPDRYHAMQNQDVDKEDAVTIARWKKRKEMCEAEGLNVVSVFPPAPGTPVSPEVAEMREMIEQSNNKNEDE